MPLEPGSSNAVVSRNISELTHHGSRPRPHAQIVAIALHNADKYKHRAAGGLAAGGFAMPKPMAGLGGAGAPRMMLPRNHIMATSAPERLANGGFPLGESTTPFFVRNEARNLQNVDIPHGSGLFNSDVAGRTDRLPHAVAADSFVLPADVVSTLGQGNTMAGSKIMDAIMSSGPYGIPLTHPRAAGGSTPGVSHVMVAGGEYLIHRRDLEKKGRLMRAAGKSRARTDLAAGHEWARQFVETVRKHAKKFLNHAPKPKK